MGRRWTCGPVGESYHIQHSCEVTSWSPAACKVLSFPCKAGCQEMGLKAVCEEREVNTARKNVESVLRELAGHLDSVHQVNMMEWIYYICLFLPNFHPEKLRNCIRFSIEI